MIAAVPPRRRAAPITAKAASDRVEANTPTPFVVNTSSPLAGVDWSISYVAFIVYIFVITTYRIPVGTEAMALSLIALPLEKRGLRFPTVAFLGCLLVGWAFLGWTTTEFPEIVFDTMTEFAKVCAVILVAMNVLTSKARIRAFVLLFLIAFMIYPGRGTLIGYFTGNTVAGRAIWNVTYSNPNDLAGLTLLQLAMALGLAEVEKKYWVRLFAWVCIGVMTLIIILTQSRGAFIALVAILCISGRNVLRNPRNVLALVLLAGLVAIVAPKKVWERFSTVSDAVDATALEGNNDEAASSTVQRLEIWRVARTMIAENFIFGVGLGGYSSAHYLLAQRPNFKSSALGKRDTHSTYLNLLAETGVVGLGLFAALMILPLRDSSRARKLLGKRGGAQAAQLLYLELGLIGFLVAGIWGSYSRLMPLYVHVALLSMASELFLQEYKESKASKSRALRPGMRGYQAPSQRARARA